MALRSLLFVFLLLTLLSPVCPATAEDASQSASQDASQGASTANGGQTDTANAPAQQAQQQAQNGQAQSAPDPSAQSQTGQTQTGQTQTGQSGDHSDSMSWDDSTASPPQSAATPAEGGQSMSRIPGLATPSPYDDSDPMFNKPFSLSRLRTFKPQPGALTKVSKDATAPSDITVEAKACDMLTGKQAQDMDSFRQHLVDKAKEQAAYQLFTRMFAGQSQVGQQETLPPSYQHALAGKIQVTGKPSFYNGEDFGQLCVKLTASLPSQHVSTAAPLIATLQNFCYRDGGLDETALENKAKDAALERIVQNIAPGAQVPEQSRSQLLQEAKVNGSLGGDHNDVYCLDMQLEVAPLELLTHVPGRKGSRPLPGQPQTLASASKSDWFLDLSKYAVGEPVTEYGKNLVVYQDSNGKCLGPNSRDGALAILPATSSGADFTLRVLVARSMSYDFLYKQTVEFFRMHFNNKQWDQGAFVMSLDDNNKPVAYFQSRLQSSDTFPWDMAVNFNDCFLIKQQGQIRFFFNGRFILAYPSQGGALTQVRVPLQWNDRLYNVLVKNLDGQVK